MTQQMDQSPTRERSPAAAALFCWAACFHRAGRVVAGHRLTETRQLYVKSSSYYNHECAGLLVQQYCTKVLTNLCISVLVGRVPHRSSKAQSRQLHKLSPTAAHLLHALTLISSCLLGMHCKAPPPVKPHIAFVFVPSSPHAVVRVAGLAWPHGQTTVPSVSVRPSVNALLNVHA